MARRPPPAQIPEWVNTVLSDAGLSSADRVTRLQGRNDSYLAETPTGGYVVKRLTGPGSRERYARSVGHARLFSTALPELVHDYAPHCALVFRELPDAVSGNQLLVEERFTPALCAEVGRSIARVHAVPCSQVAALPAPTVNVPGAKALTALPLEGVHYLTAGEIEAWRLIHSDAALVRCLLDLGNHTAHAPRTCVHGDFRLDQVLVWNDAAHLVDWEEFGAGDPAADTGTWIGEWVYRAALDIPTARGDGVGTGQTRSVLDHRSLSSEDIIRRGVAKLDALSPHMLAFWDAYRQERPVSAPELERVVRFAGWHLVERLLALAQTKAVLPGVTRAAAGIGRRLLLDPAAAAEALSLGPSPVPRGAVA